MSQLVSCGKFVRRQTADSGYSHFDGTWDELEKWVAFYMGKGDTRPGYRDGVMLVDMPGKMFYSAIVALDIKSKINASYSSRREGEASYIRLSAKGQKQQAQYASVVLYRADVLAENNERETDADWEIVAIKARVSEQEEPMDPYTMARNFLHLDGGTKGDFSAQQFAESIVYWNNHCMLQGKKSWWKRFLGK